MSLSTMPSISRLAREVLSSGAAISHQARERSITDRSISRPSKGSQRPKRLYGGHRLCSTSNALFYTFRASIATLSSQPRPEQLPPASTFRQREKSCCPNFQTSCIRVDCGPATTDTIKLGLDEPHTQRCREGGRCDTPARSVL